MRGGRLYPWVFDKNIPKSYGRLDNHSIEIFDANIKTMEDLLQYLKFEFEQGFDQIELNSSSYGKEP